MNSEIGPDIEARKKKREGILLFVIFGSFIVAAIAVIFFIDYYYAEGNVQGQQTPHDAADR